MDNEKDLKQVEETKEAEVKEIADEDLEKVAGGRAPLKTRIITDKQP